MTGEALEQTEVSEYGNPSVTSVFSTIRTFLAVFGLLANTITGVVLTNKRLWNPTSMLLLSLVAYDAVFLLASIPPNVMLGISDPGTFAILLGICYPMRYMAQTGSIYTTVTVTVERFLIVYRPLKARVFCTFGKTRKVIFGVFLFSVIFNIPRCFFYKLYTSFVFRHIIGIALGTGPYVHRFHPKYAREPTLIISSDSMLVDGDSLQISSFNSHRSAQGSHRS